MADKFRTEAERKATPRPPALPNTPVRRNGGGQKSSLERGSHTRSKKSAGKRPHGGG